jgi:hypothetical protein
VEMAEEADKKRLQPEATATGGTLMVPDTPWKRATQQRRAMRSEQQAAKQEGGKRQPASGSLRNSRLKGDVRANGFLIDDKFTDKKSFSVTMTDWQKLTQEAFALSLLPSQRVTLPGVKLRVFREEDALYLIAKAALGNVADN